MRPKTAGITKSSRRSLETESKVQQDFDRNIKRQVGTIRTVDRDNNNRLSITVDVPNGRGGFRLFGEGKTPVIIIDSPLDILMRFGGVAPGQIVELFYRGIGETGTASARIIGSENEEFVEARDIPKEGFSVEASLPFEPGSIF